ncbi:hypothetical protein D3C77_359950 [compost metagenome]
MLQAFLIGSQGLLLMVQLLIGLLAGLGRRVQLLLQAGGVFLQGQQGVLALLVAADVVVQASRLQFQPGRSLADVLLAEHREEFMGLQGG